MKSEVLRQTTLFFVGISALAILLFIIVWTNFAALVGDLRQSAPVVTVPIAGAAAIPGIVMMGGLLAIVASGLAGRKSEKRSNAMFIALLGGFPLMLLFPVGLSMWSHMVLPGWGYSRCAAADNGGRYFTSVWARGIDACAQAATP